MSHAPLPSSDPDPVPSSPTSTSFYSRPTPASASSSRRSAYKTTTSRRHSLPAQGAHSRTLFAGTPPQNLRHALLASRPAASASRNRPQRVVPDVENPFVEGMYAHGGVVDGVWEENTEEEEAILARRVERDARRKREAIEDSWVDEWGQSFIQEEEEDQQEPPPEFVYDPPDDPAAAYQPFTALLPNLPSLASSAPPSAASACLSSSPPQGYAHAFAAMETDGDATMGDSQESYLPPSSPPPLPTPISDYEYEHDGNLEDGETTMGGDAGEVMARVRAFGEALLGASCPACGAGVGVIQGSEAGAKCASCGWGIEMGVLEKLGDVFGRHADLTTHRPLFAWTQYTGTLVLCSGCDIELAD